MSGALIADIFRDYFPRENTEWMQQADCASVDGDVWFPEATKNSSLPAKRICLTCPVRETCLDYAMRHNIREGVWGGANEWDRTQIRAGLLVDLVVACRHCGDDMPHGPAAYCSDLCKGRAANVRLREKRQRERAA